MLFSDLRVMMTLSLGRSCIPGSEDNAFFFSAMQLVLSLIDAILVFLNGFISNVSVEDYVLRFDEAMEVLSDELDDLLIA